MNFIKEMSKHIIELLSSEELNSQEKAVLFVINKFWGVRHVTQNEIIQQSNWKQAAKGAALNDASSCRIVRRIIRRLRVNHKVPILHDMNGHYLPEDYNDARIFVERLEREVRGKAASSRETYRALKDVIGVSSSLLDNLAELEDEKPPERHKNRPSGGVIAVMADGKPNNHGITGITIDWSQVPPAIPNEDISKQELHNRRIKHKLLSKIDKYTS